jgi:hypothetical protein
MLSCAPAWAAKPNNDNREISVKVHKRLVRICMTFPQFGDFNVLELTFAGRSKRPSS